jgi:small subunit ribosomal protein S20
MPNKHAAIKDLRKNKRRAARNLRLKTHARSLLRKAKDLLKEGKVADAKAAAASFQQIVDKAAKHGVLSKNAAGHKKSSIMKAISKAK